jgi:hypothetical protein
VKISIDLEAEAELAFYRRIDPGNEHVGTSLLPFHLLSELVALFSTLCRAIRDMPSIEPELSGEPDDLQNFVGPVLYN